MRELAGRVAVVTGAASGIGRAVAGRCAAAGMKVVLSDIEAGALERAADELAATGADVAAFVTDVSRAESVEELARRTTERFGAVHLVHNNAGVAAGGPIWECTEADWQWVLGVNLWGVIHGVRTFVPRMLEQGGEGHIVNTASIAGLTSLPMLGPYTVSKHGVVALSETLARDLAMRGSEIKVSVLCPGWVDTGIFESGRNRPDELRNPGGETFDTAAVRSFLQGVLAPEIVADHVMDAVRHDQFYIFTHPEMAAGVRVRMEDILAGRTPTLDRAFG